MSAIDHSITCKYDISKNIYSHATLMLYYRRERDLNIEKIEIIPVIGNGQSLQKWLSILSADKAISHMFASLQSFQALAPILDCFVYKEEIE